MLNPTRTLLASVLVAAAFLSGCSDTKKTATEPQFSTVGAHQRYSVDNLTMDVQQSNGATVIVAMTEVDGHTKIAFVQRNVGKVSFLTYQLNGRMITAMRKEDGSTVYVPRHDVVSGGTCGTEWLNGEHVGSSVSSHCDVGGVTPYMTCIPSEDYSCDGGGGDGVDLACCQREADAYRSAQESMWWAAGAMAVACIWPEPAEPAACTFATAYYTRQVYIYDVAASAYKSCKDAAKYNTACKTIAYQVPWDKKEVFA